MDVATLAYLAGAMDSDGWFGIKRSTYHIRVRGDAVNPVYSERIGLKQVTPQIPELLRDTFGGSFRTGKGGTENSKPLFAYNATDKVAAEACRALLPYLRIKSAQARLVIELRETKEGAYWQAAHWFAKEFPDWPTMELITTTEATRLLGYTHPHSINLAIRNGTILALPYDHSGQAKPRIPRALIERVRAVAGKDGRARNQAPELVAWRERLYQEIRTMNKIGINGTPVYHLTGHYTQAK